MSTATLSAAHACAICGHKEGNTTFTAREMLFGRRDPFTYFECCGCGCVQITSVPANLAEYYPKAYFAFRPQHKLARSRWRGWIDGKRVDHAEGLFSPLGWVANKLATPLNYVTWMRESRVDRTARVLDIGCGAGKLIVRMRHAGFRECIGLDPYIEQTLRYANGAVVHRETVDAFANEHQGAFDLIMLHHALEHMPEQADVLNAVRRLLAPRGCVLVRIPLAGGYAWRTYRENWVQLDPPRHLYLHTPQSMETLAANAGLQVEKVVYDSTARQLLGSELWVRDIATNEAHPERAAIEARKEEFSTDAAALNCAGDGDMAAFYLRLAC